MTPPDYVIEIARGAAMQSPCAKSKRGAVAFDIRGRYERTVEMYSGFNGQPQPLACTGSDRCRKECARICMHAEQRAILSMLASGRDPARFEIVHVKVIGAEVVPGGGPGCEQCSRLILDRGFAGIWLFEKTDCPSANCPLCTGEFCMVHDGGCECASDERHKGRQPPQGEWKFYDAEEFHRITLRNLELTP